MFRQFFKEPILSGTETEDTDVNEQLAKGNSLVGAKLTLHLPRTPGSSLFGARL
jgi:hypothetical protein